VRLPVCTDRDDQKFLEIARDADAQILVTKDKALLKLARKTAQAGMFRIMLPEAWVKRRMSALAAQQHGAVNLGQGFPDFDCDPRSASDVVACDARGHNQYPMMAGAAPLRRRSPRKIGALYGRDTTPNVEITVTAGATQALTTAILCCVHPGDEVIVIEPAYDSYVPAIELAGGTPVLVQMTLEDARYAIPWDKHGRRGHAEHAPADRQHAAQPDRHGAVARRPLGAGRDRARHRHPDAVRRSLRAHGLRRRAARVA
jgi:hypothetical protein